MTTSSDWDERLWAWVGSRDAIGPKMPGMYEELVQLENEAAKLTGTLSRYRPTCTGLVQCEYRNF